MNQIRIQWFRIYLIRTYNLRKRNDREQKIETRRIKMVRLIAYVYTSKPFYDYIFS